MDEFELIKCFFKNLSSTNNGVLLGIGDDAACLKIPSGTNLLVSTDTLVSNTHFRPDWHPYDIAYRAVMTNISDMAAMAAEPLWVTLALTLPEIDSSWLEGFAQGLKAALDSFNIALVGGDTTKGPLTISLTIMGIAPEGKEVKRKGAQASDLILVSGYLGAAALAVLNLDNSKLPQPLQKQLMDYLLHPKPRVDLIPILRAYASSAVDISDGLSADLGHICKASGVGACLNQADLPIHPILKQYMPDQALNVALTGGDDYELCFTIPLEAQDAMMEDLKKAKLKVYPVGIIEKQLGLRIKKEEGLLEVLHPKGYSHF